MLSSRCCWGTIRNAGPCPMVPGEGHCGDCIRLLRPQGFKVAPELVEFAGRWLEKQSPRKGGLHTLTQTLSRQTVPDECYVLLCYQLRYSNTTVKVSQQHLAPLRSFRRWPGSMARPMPKCCCDGHLIRVWQWSPGPTQSLWQQKHKKTRVKTSTNIIGHKKTTSKNVTKKIKKKPHWFFVRVLDIAG